MSGKEDVFWREEFNVHDKRPTLEVNETQADDKSLSHA